MTVTDAGIELGYPEALNWISCNIFNEGPDPIYYRINNGQQSVVPIQAGGNISLDFRMKKSINKIWLNCDHGKTATVQAIGLL